ncbi:MAG: response regulator [Candidatus Marinimicrobia bacterium]|nr:response regulator [Candidatus Neomarinimicrobiota bacterium]
MKSLIVDDELTTRLMLKKILSPYGPSDTVSNGKEAITAFWLALKDKEPYDLICLDILMPEVNGKTVLKKIREIEDMSELPKNKKVNIFMVTSLNDSKTIMDTIVKYKCDSYILKPVSQAKVISKLKQFNIIQ